MMIRPRDTAARAAVRATRYAALTAAWAGLAALTGCAGLPAPVAAWEKGNLARPEMAFDSDPLRKAFVEHVTSSKEGASGGTGVAGGGCGCN
jgi:hypothetical protein